MDTNSIFLKFVKNVDEPSLKSITRSGIIPYMNTKNGLLFMLGIDAKSGDISDFSGTVNAKYDVDPINTAIREFDEETLSIFFKLRRNELMDCICCGDKTNMIIFIPMKLDQEVISNSFEKKWTNTSEMNDIIFCYEQTFINMISYLSDTFTMYERIQKVITGTILKYGIFF